MLKSIAEILNSLNLEHVDAVPAEDLWLSRMSSGEGCVEIVKLQGGATYRPHRHNKTDAHLFVLSGSGVAIVGEQEIVYEQGAHCYVAVGAAHGFKTNEEAFLLSVQSNKILDQDAGTIDFVYQDV